MKIAIFSSWLPEVSPYNTKLVKEMVAYLHEKNITIVTGGCSGIPALAIETAFQLGGKTVGYFPHKSRGEYHDRQHEQNTHSIDYYTTVHFISGFTARSLKMIKDVDAAIVINGRIGTLSEFSIAVEEGLPIAVIERTGGIADEIRKISQIVKKEFPNNEVIFDNNFKRAVDSLILNYENQLKKIN